MNYDDCDGDCARDDAAAVVGERVVVSGPSARALVLALGPHWAESVARNARTLRAE